MQRRKRSHRRRPVRLLSRGTAAKPTRKGPCSSASSEHAQEIDQVLLFLICVTDIETAVVEIDQLAKRCRGAVREIRRSRRKRAHLLRHREADVGTLAGDQRSPGIMRVDLPTEVRMRGGI